MAHAVSHLRMCGARKPGKVYLCSDTKYALSGVLCPPADFKLSMAAQGVQIHELPVGANTVQFVFDLVGAENYPHPLVFISEAIAMGISRTVNPEIAKSLRMGAQLALMHNHVVVGGPEMEPHSGFCMHKQKQVNISYACCSIHAFGFAEDVTLTTGHVVKAIDPTPGARIKARRVFMRVPVTHIDVIDDEKLAEEIMNATDIPVFYKTY